MHFTFQESMIWEAGDPVDPKGKKVRIKAKTEARARKQLPNSTLGRKWILINTEERRDARL